MKNLDSKYVTRLFVNLYNTPAYLEVLRSQSKTKFTFRIINFYLFQSFLVKTIQ